MTTFDNMPRVRNTDVETSHLAAARVNAESQCLALLEVFKGKRQGLTADEALSFAVGSVSRDSCYWKRIGELRDKGFIEWLYDKNGNQVKRRGFRGREQGVSLITPAGVNFLKGKK